MALQLDSNVEFKLASSNRARQHQQNESTVSNIEADFDKREDLYERIHDLIVNNESQLCEKQFPQKVKNNVT